MKRILYLIIFAAMLAATTTPVFSTGNKPIPSYINEKISDISQMNSTITAMNKKLRTAENKMTAAYDNYVKPKDSLIAMYNSNIRTIRAKTKQEIKALTQRQNILKKQLREAQNANNEAKIDYIKSEISLISAEIREKNTRKEEDIGLIKDNINPLKELILDLDNDIKPLKIQINKQRSNINANQEKVDYYTERMNFSIKYGYYSKAEEWADLLLDKLKALKFNLQKSIELNNEITSIIEER